MTLRDPDVDALEVRIIRTMTDVDSGGKRAMYAGPSTGEGGKWLSLRDKDVQLLVSVGYDKMLFLKSDHVFRSANQPLIKIMETSKSVFEVHSVWSTSRKQFIVHKESKVAEETVKETKVAVEKPAPKPAAITKAVTFEAISNKVDEMSARSRTLREQAQAADNLILTPEDIQRQDAEILKDVVIQSDQGQENYGKIQLAAMWRLRQTGAYMHLPNNPGSIAEAFRNEPLYQRDYTLSLALIVDRIFAAVAALEKAKKPFINPVTGEPITVEWLIVTPGLIQKMKKASSLFERLPKLEDRRKLIGAIASESNDKVNATMLSMQKLLPGASDDDNDETKEKASFLIPVKIEEIPNSKKHRIILDVDDAEQAAVMRLLGPITQSVTQ